MELRRFAFSTQAYTRHSLEQALKQIAAAGFKSVELLADKPHLWLDSMDAEAIGRLGAELARLDLTVSNLNSEQLSGYWNDPPPGPIYEPSLISPTRALREWRIAYLKKALRMGKELGAASVSITSGGAFNGMPPEAARKVLLEGLKRLAEYAAKIEQPLALACAPTLLVENTNELADIIRSVHGSHFGGMLDVSLAAAAGENLSQSIRKLKGRLFGVHLADHKGVKFYPRLPGDGVVNFRTVIGALSDNAYTGALTWNPYSHGDDLNFACRKVFRYIKPLFTTMRNIQ